MALHLMAVKDPRNSLHGNSVFKDSSVAFGSQKDLHEQQQQDCPEEQPVMVRKLDFFDHGGVDSPNVKHLSLLDELQDDSLVEETFRRSLHDSVADIEVEELGTKKKKRPTVIDDDLEDEWDL